MMRAIPITKGNQLIPKSRAKDTISITAFNYVADIRMMRASEKLVLANQIIKDLSGIRGLKQYSHVLDRYVKSKIDCDCDANGNGGAEIIRFVDRLGRTHIIVLTPIMWDYQVTYWMCRDLPSKHMLLSAECLE